MKSEWLTASGFERASEILLAINTLSIHAKLILAGITDPANPLEIQQARLRLVAFLEGLKALVENTEKDHTKVITGTDPRFSELALHYLEERRRVPSRSIFFSLPIGRVEELIQSEQEHELRSQVECLETMRAMVEQIAQTDFAGIFDDE